MRKKDRCLPATARPDQRVLGRVRVKMGNTERRAGPRYHVGER